MRILAKQVVQLRSQRDKLIGVKAHVGAIGMQASTMAATAGVVEPTPLAVEAGATAVAPSARGVRTASVAHGGGSCAAQADQVARAERKDQTRKWCQHRLS